MYDFMEDTVLNICNDIYRGRTRQIPARKFAPDARGGIKRDPAFCALNRSIQPARSKLPLANISEISSDITAFRRAVTGNRGTERAHPIPHYSGDDSVHDPQIKKKGLLRDKMHNKGKGFPPRKRNDCHRNSFRPCADGADEFRFRPFKSTRGYDGAVYSSR